MNQEKSVHATRLHVESRVPCWYRLAPLERRVGLQVTLHQETWREVLQRCGTSFCPEIFKTGQAHEGWLTIKFPYAATNPHTLQSTVSSVLNALSFVQNKRFAPDEYQLAAAGILRSVPELKGYLLDAYISHELKTVLAKTDGEMIAQLARRAMRQAVRALKAHMRPATLIAFVREGGFLYFGISDGSGTCFGTDYRDLDCAELECGYSMTSDNIDSPNVQLIFLMGLAAVSEWGRKQLINAS